MRKLTSLISHSASNEGLAGTRGPVHEDTTRGLHADSLEQRGVAQRQLHHLLDLGQLLAATADVVVADGVQSFFFLLGKKMWWW